MRRLALTLLSAAALFCSCQSGVNTADEGCIKVDSVFYARGFRIEYCEGYTSVAIRNPWDTLKLKKRYILVEKGRDLPERLPDGIVIRTPVERAVVYASVHASMVEQMGASGSIAGICESEYVTSSAIRSMVDSGLIVDVGLSTSPDVEKITELNADVIIASPFENSGYGAAEKLGIPIVEAADYMESHPLGRTEWGRFYGLLFGRQAQADSIFKATAGRYNELKHLASSAKDKPTVLLERKYGGSWPVPTGSSYISVFHSDAGADYIFKDYVGGEAASLPFEKVLDLAVDADLWLFKYGSEKQYSYKDLEEEYKPYSHFEAFKKRHIYACNTFLTPYYEDLTLHPDLILEEFISLYHPELLPGYKPRYYLPLQQ